MKPITTLSVFFSMIFGLMCSAPIASAQQCPYENPAQCNPPVVDCSITFSAAVYSINGTQGPSMMSFTVTSDPPGYDIFIDGYDTKAPFFNTVWIGHQNTGKRSDEEFLYQTQPGDEGTYERGAILKEDGQIVCITGMVEIEVR